MKMFSNLKLGRCWQAIKSLPAIIFALLLVGAAIPTFAVHDVALFELDTRDGMDGDQDKKNDPYPLIVGDGNTADDAAVLGDDWANVYLGTDSADVTSFIEDTFANNNIDNGAEAFVALRTPEISFFTGGGSKDTNGIQEGPWKYKVISDQVPDKNDIVNAFAALYSQAEGDPILYFGLDTFSVNGDANAGFWFFRDDVSLAPLGEGEDTGTFVGEHRDGDLFVAVAYTQGGRVGDIDVYQWSGDDATGGLVLMESGQDCATVGADDNVCGVINKLLPDQTFGEDPVFDYANTLVANNPLDPTSYQYESAAFVEFGLVLDTTLFPNGIGCFSTFMAETRSSQSESAQLKDLALGNFDVCSIDVTKTGDGKSKVGDDVDYSITVTNTGLATLYKQSITDTLLGDLTGDAGCGASLASGASCVINVSRTVLAGDPDPLPNTVTIVYTEFADPASLSFTANDDHSVDLFQPAIDVSKTGDTLSKVGDDVDYVITLSNNSSADTPALNCTATESFGGEIYNGILPAGDTVINFSRTVQADDPDPLVNTVDLNCVVAGGFGNVLNASDNHSTDLFQPAIDVAKTGDALSKVGDDVDYTITLSNNSSAGTPDMSCVATDDLLGEVFNGVLPAGDTVINATRTVQAGDPDPLVNTVTMDCSVAGFSNTLTDKDSHSTNLFQPAIDVAKTGDALSKVGDDVDYTITLSNNSSGDTPDMSCVATDTLMGEVFNGVLPAGDTVINNSRTVLADDPDPLVNSVTMNCTVGGGFGNALSDSDSHETNLFQPSITFDKTGDTLSKVGDDVNYVITLNNTSSADTPDMDCTISDAMLGINKSVTLASGASDVINTSYTVLGTDSDPLNNTASASCSPVGFPNVLPASDGHSVDLFQPAINVAKTGDALSKVGDDVDYTITLSNNSSAGTPDLNCVATDSLLGEVFNGVLPAGDTVINNSRTVLADDPDPLVNSVTMNCTVGGGFGNTLSDSDSHSTNLFQPAINVAKIGDALSKVGDLVDYSITLSNNSSADTPAMDCVATDSLLGEVYNGVLPLGDTVIAASRTVQAGDGDPLINSVTMNCTVGGGFGNALSDNDSHSTNLFQPSVTIDKTANCDLDVPIGALITYNYLITNTSSADTPDLSLASISDDKVGDLSTAATNAGCASLASGASCNFNATYDTALLPVGAIVNIVDVAYNPAGWPNNVPASDTHTCNVVLPEPATVVIEKVLLNAEGSTFNYSSNGIQIAAAWDETLMPQFVPVPPQNVESPFAPAGAGNSFATTTELVVNVPNITQNVQASVEELLPLPDQIYFNSLACAAANNGFLTGYTVVDKLASLTLGSGDFAFCRYVNEFIPGDEGCTPGFWKNSPGSWPDTAYATDNLVEDIFQYNNGVAHTIPASYFSGNPKTRLSHTDTLMDALNYGGGDDNEKGAAMILLRAATAAILNATHTGVNYTRSADSIIMEVVNALETKDRDTILTLATELDWDNNLGCPLSNDNSF